MPTARALPIVVDAVGSDLTVLVDSGIRSGLDVVRMLALGAKGVLLGRAYIYALAAGGQQGVAHLLDLFAADMKVTMTLIGAKTPADITCEALDSAAKRLTRIQGSRLPAPRHAPGRSPSREGVSAS